VYLQDGGKPAPIELQFSPEVQRALQQNRPVVALESTIISHGELTAADFISISVKHISVRHSMH
jgi:pseudouridine-5'-phosphate glycosidase